MTHTANISTKWKVPAKPITFTFRRLAEMWCCWQDGSVNRRSVASAHDTSSHDCGTRGFQLLGIAYHSMYQLVTDEPKIETRISNLAFPPAALRPILALKFLVSRPSP